MTGGSYSKAFMVPNPLAPGPAVVIDPEYCTGCNSCVDSCRRDVLLPNPEPGGPPLTMYPDECWFCGCCAEDCPEQGAITMVHPLGQRAIWKRKDTGEFYRIGMRNPPAPNNRPPVG